MGTLVPLLTHNQQADKQIFIKNTEDKKLAFFNKNKMFERFMSDDEVRNLVNFIKLYQKS